MAEVNSCRYKCISRVDKKTVTGKTDYKDRYFYRIFDKVSGKTLMFDGINIKKEISNGTKIEGLELTVDGRLMFKESKASKTVMTPSGAKESKNIRVGKNTSQCVDLSLAIIWLNNELSYNYGIRGAKTLRILNCGYGTIEKTIAKAKMIGGRVYDFNNQKIILMSNNNTVTLYAEKWAYSNKRESNWSDGTFGALAAILGVTDIEINGIEFVTNSLKSAFSSYKSRLQNIKIMNSDMTYIRDMDNMCSGLQLNKLEILDTNLNNVVSMNGTFNTGPFKGVCSDAPMVLDIPKVPNLVEARYLFGGYKRSCQPDMRFLDGAKIKDARNMFSLSSLSYLDLKDLDLTQCVNADSMFSECRNLEKVDFGTQKLTKLETANSMFSDCESLKYLDLMCIESPGLKRSNEDFLPRSKQQRTTNMFKNINKNVKIRISQEMLDIIKANSGQ